MDVHPWAQPNLDYLAPESGCGYTQVKANDMFSLGILIFAIYNKGNAPLQSNHDWSTYKRNIQEVYIICLLINCCSLKYIFFR